jgi:hypothetical protein
MPVRDVADRLAVSEKTVYRMISASCPRFRIAGRSGWTPTSSPPGFTAEGGSVNEYVTTYRVAGTFELGGRTFRRGEELPGNDPDVSLLLRCETLLGRQLLVRNRLVDRPSLSSNASETVAWRSGTVYRWQ